MAVMYKTDTTNGGEYLLSYLGFNKEQKRDINKTKSLNEVDAIKSISSLIKTKRIVIINEDHTTPNHRTFIGNLIDTFYKYNFRTLAVEALTSAHDIQSLTMRDPKFLQYLHYANTMGFKIINYDDVYNFKPPLPIKKPDFEIDSTIYISMNQRDYNQYLYLDSIITRLHKDEKILIHVGIGHGKLYETTLWKSLGSYLKEKYSDQLLSIDQVFLNSRLNSNDFSIAYSENNKLESFEEFDPLLGTIKMYDISITHPTNKNIRPNFLKKTVVVNHKEKVDNYPALILTYRCEDNPYEDIPFDIRYIKSKEDVAEMYISDSKYQLLIKDINNKIVYYGHNCDK